MPAARPTIAPLLRWVGSPGLVLDADAEGETDGRNVCDGAGTFEVSVTRWTVELEQPYLRVSGCLDGRPHLQTRLTSQTACLSIPMPYTTQALPVNIIAR
jgi:hypothetical protein